MRYVLFAYLIAIFSPAVLAQTIVVSALTEAPKIDGEGSEWDQVTGFKIFLTPTQPNSSLESREILVKAGSYQGQVYFFVKWPDQKADILHKPYQWDEGKQRYVKGSDREDRFAIQFEMSGDYSTDWANAQDFEADMWHWKASRSNPLGIAQDKKTTLSRNKILRGASMPSADGSKRYVLRESDAGTKLYKTLRYGKKEQAVMPKYELLANPQGSITDVSAKGIWSEGHWQLELGRKFDTGHIDDIRFALGQLVRGGIAVFDASSNENHIISKTLLFQF